MASISHKQLKTLRRQQNGLQAADDAPKLSERDPLANRLPRAAVSDHVNKQAAPELIREVARGYPKGSTDAKVFAPFVCDRGAIPRHVLVQRRKAEYAKKNLVDHLLDHGVDYSKEGPGGVIPGL